MDIPYQGDLQGKTHQETWRVIHDDDGHDNFDNVNDDDEDDDDDDDCLSTCQGTQTLVLHRSHSALPQVLCNQHQHGDDDEYFEDKEHFKKDLGIGTLGSHILHFICHLI